MVMSSGSTFLEVFEDTSSRGDATRSSCRWMSSGQPVAWVLRLWNEYE